MKVDDTKSCITKFLLPTILLVGALLIGYWLGRSCVFGRPFRFEDRDAFRAHILNEMTQELDLTQDQRVEIEKILDEKGQMFGKIKEELKPRFKEIVETTRSRIRSVLRPEQIDKFEKFKEKMRPPFKHYSLGTHPQKGDI